MRVASALSFLAKRRQPTDPRPTLGPHSRTRMVDPEPDPSVSSSQAIRGGRMCGGTFTHAKAGMKGVDKEKIEKRVYSLTVGSKYYQNEQKHRDKLDCKIAEMKRKLEMHPVDVATRAHTERRVAEIERHAPPLASVFIVLDMDAFYAKCEERANPLLRDQVFAVGGTCRFQRRCRAFRDRN